MCFIKHMSYNNSVVSSPGKCVAVGKSITQCLLYVYIIIIHNSTLLYIKHATYSTTLLILTTIYVDKITSTIVYFTTY